MPLRTTARLVIQPIALAIVLALVTRAYVRIYSVPSGSMEPTLTAGDHIVASPYRTTEPGRGDIVIFHRADTTVVKRIVGTPGDLIETRAGRVFIGGHAIAEPYLREPAATGVIAPQIIPGGCYFVMGDNRGDSFDSRAWGVVPRDLVTGRVWMILWSSGDGGSARTAQASPQRAAAGEPAGIRFHRLFRLVR
jgi:signal peptidase I